MIIWKAVEESDMKKSVGKVCSILERNGKRKFLLSCGHVEAILLLASVNMDNHLQSHMGNGRQHREISVHSKSLPGTKQQTYLNSLNLTLVLFLKKHFSEVR